MNDREPEFGQKRWIMLVYSSSEDFQLKCNRLIATAVTAAILSFHQTAGAAAKNLPHPTMSSW
jgi:hypothetical protein